MSASGATLIKADQQATNGVVQVIDRVLYSIPDDTISNYIQENSRLRKLAMLMQIADYQDSIDSKEKIINLGSIFYYLCSCFNDKINNNYFL